MLLISLALTVALQAAPAAAPAPASKAEAPAPKTTVREQRRQPLMERSVGRGPVQAVLPADGKPKL